MAEMAELAAGKRLITADRVWTAGNGAEVIDHGVVLTEGGSITAVGRQADLGSAADDAQRVDFPGSTVLPGLINAHVHLVFSASLDPVADLLAEQRSGTAALTIRAMTSLQLSARAGVTTVRDLGGPNEVIFGVRDAVDDGRVAAPRVIASGEPITITGGHCHWFSHECDTSDEIRRAVRRQVSDGANLVKIFATGGNMTPRTNPFAPQYTQEQLQACVEEATRLGVQVAAHAHAPEGIRRAANVGVSTIEHCFFETADGVEYNPETGETMARDKVAFVPTMGANLLRMRENAALVPDRPVVKRLLARFELLQGALRDLHAAGAPLVFGNDAGIPQRVHHGFAADVGALTHPDTLGISPLAALEAVTSASAAHLGLGDCGVLEVGRRADVLAVDGNPLTDIADLERTRFVLAGGRPITAGPER